jgi:hypothetical protein
MLPAQPLEVLLEVTPISVATLSSPIGRPRKLAWRIARRSSFGEIGCDLPDEARRRSEIVRAGVVTGMPLRRVIEEDRSD